MNYAATANIPAAMESIDRIPRIACGVYPTPLEEMTRLRETIGTHCPRIFMKRDDYTGTAFGSNKLRKLDYAIADEITRGTKIIVTIAGECSNHARVTAAVCAKLGLECILVLNRANANGAVEGMVHASRFAYERFGAKVHWVQNREDRQAEALKIVDDLRGRGKKAAFLPLGVSFPLGAVGFVRAVNEVAGQFSKISALPTHIFHASTSGGTQAGLVAGCQLRGWETQIVGVSPDDPAGEVASRVAKIVNGMASQFSLPLVETKDSDITVLDQFIGDGYGEKTAESAYARELAARTEAVILDHTYTAKAFAAVLNWIEEGSLSAEDTVLFWHTGGHLAGLYAPSNGG